ncbi:ion transporter [Solobacterium moorei]|uniref:ion transporter n=1 Tax=Solobacterium moorei TaxID=102148 RepID=UPI0003F693E0|nr:ion transporter [Solobacterium moorei]BET21275.1 ion transporter [Solobacterium moorei]
MNYSKWRQRLFELVDVVDTTGDNIPDFDAYDLFMMIVIFVSIVPLLFKNDTHILIFIDKITVVIFIIDYLLRWITADIRDKSHSLLSFIKYPFTPMAIMDLLSIIPSLTSLNDSFKLLKIFRMMRTFKMVRALKVFKVARAAKYSKSLSVIIDVFKQSKEPLMAVGTLSAAYVFISALIIFNVEPDSFKSFFDAIYWAIVSLTTVGYGDIYPTTTIGRAVAMVSSIFGIAIVALPAGIITAGYMKSVNSKNNE